MSSAISENKENGLIEVFKQKPRLQIGAILVFVLLGVSAIITVAAVLATPSDEPETQFVCGTAHESYNLSSDAPLGVYTQFAVSVDHHVCSTIGKEILAKGGSAVDAAISASICNSVMNPHSMGLGGGCFINIFLKESNKSYIIDAREAAPMSSSKDMFVNDTDKALFGGLASGIPGELNGYHKAYVIGGRLPWAELFEPTIRLCEQGYQVSKPLASAMRSKEDLIKKNPALSEMFVNPLTNSVYREGDVIFRRKYAQTLRILAAQGYKAFYNGELTDIIVKEMNDNGANVTREDFSRYEARVNQDRLMIRIDENLRIYTPAPPSSGILVPTTIRIMKKFGFGDYKKMSNDSWILFYHRLTETFKHVYSKRTYFGDEYFVNMTSILDEMMSDKYVDEIARKIDDSKTFPASYYGAATKWEDHGTAHISILGPNGDAVSLTTTINNFFGGKYAGDTTGIIYSDTMDDFSTPGLVNSFGFLPSESNFIVPGKRPLSSMSPIIVVDNNNDVQLVLGASGGSKIMSSVAQVAIKTMWMNMDIKTAIDERRIHHQLYPEEVEFEADFPKFVTDGLRKKGHKAKCFSYGGSTMQGVQRFEGKILGFADARKGGLPDGV